MIVRKHTRNGKFVGRWYELDNGQKLYLEHCTMRAMDRKDKAWYFDPFTLRKAKEGGYSIGVCVRSRGIWITTTDYLENSEYSLKRWKDGQKQCGLPISRFQVNPLTCYDKIARAITLRR